MSDNKVERLDACLLQKALASMDFYRAPQDGVWGPKSERAYAKARQWFARGSEIRERMVEISKSEVGVKEEGDNAGRRIVEYQKCTWLPPGAWPWCAAFICWVVREALRGYSAPPGFKRPLTAAAWDFERWAMKDGGSGVRLYKPAGETNIEPGDILCYTFSHIGLATACNESEVSTVEGNTDASGGREGDGVWERQRHVSKVRSVIRLNF